MDYSFTSDPGFENAGPPDRLGSIRSIMSVGGIFLVLIVCGWWRAESSPLLASESTAEDASETALSAGVAADDTSESKARSRIPSAASALASRAPLADPVVASDAVLRCRRAAAWSEDASRFLLLHGDVSVEVGTYGFRAESAVVRIDFEETPGRRIHHLSVYLQGVRSRRGAGTVRAEAERLLVTCSTTGSIDLYTDLLDRTLSAPIDSLVTDAATRVRRYRQQLEMATIDVPPGPPLVPRRDDSLQATRRRVTDGQAAERLTRQLDQDQMVTPPLSPAPPSTKARAAPQERLLSSDEPAAAVVVAAVPEGAKTAPERILPEAGSVLLDFENVIRPGPEEYGEDVVFLFGDVAVVYQDPDGERSVSLRADRAVIFLAPDAAERIGQRRTEAADIQGVYLEDNVIASYGDYTVRGPRIYYDPPGNRAVVLDAVLYTWDPKRKVPLYLRAEQLRQESRNNWEARRAVLTTSEFAEPHFAIAARQMTIENRPQPDGSSKKHFTSTHNTLEVGGAPFFYWPHFAGDAQEIPLRRLTVGYRDNTGLDIQTTWDLFTLAGRERPDGVDLTGQVDYNDEHGPAVGMNLEYDQPNQLGFFDSYLVPSDEARDEIANRRNVDQDGDTRGYGLWRHRQYLQDDWELSLETAYLSDNTFLDEFFPREADDAKPYETSVYLKKQDDDSAFTFLSQYDLLNFSAQNIPLQSPGYTVENLPELGYYMLGRSLWDDRLTYYGETRASRMRIKAGRDSPSDRGFGNASSLLNFGIPISTTSFEDVASATGIPSGYRLRFDTRHEVQAPMELDAFDIVPYAAGRITAYDGDFDEFSRDSESLRLWGSLGLRLHTDVSRTYDGIEIRALDVHRLRHIIEPQVDLSFAAANFNPESMPVFDPDVEGIREGTTIRMGTRHTLQTQRGGLGRWRTVDWVVMNTDFVLASDDMDGDTSVARYIDFRPEFSTGGDHFHSDVMWMISDTLAAIAELNHSFEENELSEFRIGGTLRHSRRLSTFIDFATIDPLSSRLLTYGFEYQLTRKYRAMLTQRLDLKDESTRTISLIVERRLPRWRLRVMVSHDDIDDEQSIGVILVPDGMKMPRAASVFDSRDARR